MINLARLSKGEELPLFQHFRSTKTSYKFVNALGKIINAETLLCENMFVACMERLKMTSCKDDARVKLPSFQKVLFFQKYEIIHRDAIHLQFFCLKMLLAAMLRRKSFKFLASLGLFVAFM